MTGRTAETEAAPAFRTPMPATRLRSLQALGIFCGFAAGAWLGGAEAPIKLINPDISPITVSLIMVFGVFLARWSVPAFVRGTSHVRNDVRQAPHLVVWAVLAVCMLAGATLLAIASSHQAAPGKAALGIFAALGAGILWGTMYIPYRKAYLTGMNPMSFITFFTVGEFATMTVLAVAYRGATPLWHELIGAKSVMFWLMLGGFVWVLGDLFQQYATKYVGISRGIPLSNTNQLWGLLWGILVFHELRGGSQTVYEQVVGGSLLMAVGAVAIA